MERNQMKDSSGGHRRRAGLRAAIALGLAVTAGNFPGTGSASTTGSAEKGRALAERLCAHCHMAPGQGEKRGANDIPGFRAVAQRRGQTSAGIVLWLRSIPPMMPNHHLTQDEMHALADFIMTLRDAPAGNSKR
jgi:mono/diheme cytochrome c family protein